MHHRARLLLVVGLGPALLSACDQGTEPGDSLTASEARAVAIAIDDAATGALDNGSASETQFSLAPAGDPSHDLIEQTLTFDVGHPCPLGGSANLVGERAVRVDTNAGTIDIDLTAESTHEACGFRTDEDVEIELDGTVSLIAVREFSPGLIFGSNVHEGSLRFSTSEGKEGTCEIDISTELTAEEGSASKIVAGSVCGHAVTETTTWTRQD